MAKTPALIARVGHSCPTFLGLGLMWLFSVLVAVSPTATRVEFMTWIQVQECQSQRRRARAPAPHWPVALADPDLDPVQAEEILRELAGVFTQNAGAARRIVYPPEEPDAVPAADPQLPNLEARYRALVEQIPAVVFMAYLDRGIGEAYVSPQIEAALGFSQEEWLEDPVRWYSHIHPDDKQRWSTEAADMFLPATPCDQPIAWWRATDG